MTTSLKEKLSEAETAYQAFASQLEQAQQELIRRQGSILTLRQLVADQEKDAANAETKEEEQ